MPEHPPEQVLVVPTDFAELLCPTVFGVVPDSIEASILKLATFREREEAETNTAYKQVIPYIVVSHQETYMVVERTSKQQEKRLHNKLSIGQGGHINELDTKNPHPILAGLQREIAEEFKLAPTLGLLPVGMINDNSTDVSKVHLGLVFLMLVQEPVVEVAETGKHTVVGWSTADGLKRFYDRMENWSQVLVDWWLKSHNRPLA